MKLLLLRFFCKVTTIYCLQFTNIFDSKLIGLKRFGEWSMVNEKNQNPGFQFTIDHSQ